MVISISKLPKGLRYCLCHKLFWNHTLRLASSEKLIILGRLQPVRAFWIIGAVFVFSIITGGTACQRQASPDHDSPAVKESVVSQEQAHRESPAEPVNPPQYRAQKGPIEFELVQRLAYGTPEEEGTVPPEFAEIIRGLLAARASLEFDTNGRLIGVDLAGERRSGSDAEISLAVRLPHLKRFRVAGFGVTNEGIKQLATCQNLEELGLENTQIDDAGLEYLKALPRLWSLNLRRSVKLTDRAIDTLVGFPRLTHLYLLENQFSAEALMKIAQMDRLRLLDLRGCGAVNSEVLRRLSAMEHLAALRLRGYNIDDVCLQAVGGFSHLTSFTLEESPAGNAGLASLARLPLETVTLFRCTAVNDEGLRIVSQWKKLRSLTLRDMAIRGDFFKELGELPQLRSLSATQTMVSDDALHHLVACQQLEELALRQTLVTDKGLAVISRLPNLRRLDVAQTMVSDAGLVHLANLKSLEWLDLSGNSGVTDASVKILLKMPQLKEVRLDGTSMTQEAIAQLGPRARTALPVEE